MKTPPPDHTLDHKPKKPPHQLSLASAADNRQQPKTGKPKLRAPFEKRRPGTRPDITKLQPGRSIEAWVKTQKTTREDHIS